MPKDFVIVKVVSKRVNKGDDKIKAIGYLEDIATDEEISKFYHVKEIENELKVETVDTLKEDETQVEEQGGGTSSEEPVSKKKAPKKNTVKEDKKGSKKGSKKNNFII
jgi:tetrahydromethanopterin S-methyltransferase subunit A